MGLEKITGSNIDSKDEKEVREQESLLKKKINKKANPMRKIVMKAVKAAVIPMLLMLVKVLAVTLLVCLVVTLFTITITGGSGSNTTRTDTEYTSTVSTQNGGLDVTSDSLQVTEDQIKTFIDNYNNSNQDLKNKMKDKATDILNWQSNHGYSALFLITVAFEDGITSENFDSFLNTMNEKAATWKTNGYKTTQEIANNYVGDDTSQEWANKIDTNMQETAMGTGIITYGEQAISGDGYNNVFVARDGRMYRNYKQIIGSYIYEKWCGDWEIYWTGCALISVTTVVSGYQNADISPLEVVKGCAPTGQGLDIFGALSKYGLTGTRPYQNRSSGLTLGQKQELKSYLNNGNVAIIRVQKSLNSSFTDSEHWMVILDYNSSTNQVYLSNPSSTVDKTGWLDADKVLTGCTEYIQISN